MPDLCPGLYLVGNCQDVVPISDVHIVYDLQKLHIPVVKSYDRSFAAQLREHYLEYRGSNFDPTAIVSIAAFWLLCDAETLQTRIISSDTVIYRPDGREFTTIFTNFVDPKEPDGEYDSFHISELIPRLLSEFPFELLDRWLCLDYDGTYPPLTAQTQLDVVSNFIRHNLH